MFQVRASQIFTHTVEDSVAAKKALDAGSPFADLVQQYSVCPSKQTGGDLGWMNEENALSLLGERITEDHKGKIIGPIHSQYGYHLLMITDVKIETVEETFNRDTSMQALNDRFPEANTILFQKFQIGLPVSGYGENETLGSVCEQQGKPVEDVVHQINVEYSQKHIASITPERLKEKIDSGTTNLALLDIREQWERDIAVIEGAYFITRENSEKILNSLRKDMEIVLVDWKEDRSPSFLKWLNQRGFENVFALQGGIDAWAERVNTGLSRYDIDDDDDYMYEDVIEDQA